MSPPDEVMDFRAVRDALGDLGISPDKRLGQTFLADAGIAVREAEEAELSDSDTVLEIGPGLGILTRELCIRAGRVIAIEKDRRLASYLASSMIAENLEVRQGDALEAELPQFDMAVGNLPYSASSPILFRLSDAGMPRGLFMIQKEVALRAAASPFTAEYSRMSVSLQRVYEVERLFDVGHSHFYPQPEVDSSVIRLRRREGAGRWPGFDGLVTMLFSQRRKTIHSIMRKSVPAFRTLSTEHPLCARRVEELTVAQIEELTRWFEAEGLAQGERR